jgi:ABC-type uncharacterized transport system auxiliary subunit
MTLRSHSRPAATLLAVLAVAVGLAACGSSDASVATVVPPAPAPTSVAATTVVVTTTPATTTVVATTPAAEATTTTDNALVVTDAEVADLEKQLDEIDQLLAGVDADLSHD